MNLFSQFQRDYVECEIEVSSTQSALTRRTHFGYDNESAVLVVCFYIQFVFHSYRFSLFFFFVVCLSDRSITTWLYEPRSARISNLECFCFCSVITKTIRRRRNWLHWICCEEIDFFLFSQRSHGGRRTNEWTNYGDEVLMVIMWTITDRSPWHRKRRNVFVITAIGSCVPLLQIPTVLVFVWTCAHLCTGDETIDNYVCARSLSHFPSCSLPVFVGSLFFDCSPWNSHARIQTHIFETVLSTYDTYVCAQQTLPSIGRHTNLNGNFGISINNNKISSSFFSSILCKITQSNIRLKDK